MLADIQEAIWVSSVEKLLLFETVRQTKPDLIVLTGDNIAGYSAEKKWGATFSIRQVMDILSLFHTPIAAVFGNHDDEGTELTKLDQMDVYESYPTFIGCRGVVAEKTVDKTVINVGTYNLPVYADKCSDEVAFNIWCFDSGNYNPDNRYGGYGYVFPEQLEWYVEKSNELKKANGGVPVPSIAFQHIIPPQIAEALQEVPEGTPGAVDFAGKWYTLPEGTDLTKNHLSEAPCPPNLDFEPGYAEVETMLAQGDVNAIFCGHDHVNGFSVPYKGIDLVTSPGCTYGSYNDDNRGFRLITIDKNNPTAHESELLLASEILHPRTRPLLSVLATILEHIEPV